MKIRHPDFPNITKTITSKTALAKWLKAGWVETSERAAKKAAAEAEDNTSSN